MRGDDEAGEFSVKNLPASPSGDDDEDVEEDEPSPDFSSEFNISESELTPADSTVSSSEGGDAVYPKEETTQSQPTSQAELQETVKRIPPPPVRCIPEGDDEVFDEVFTEDLNDDRLTRCRRWEKKYGMSIAKYWDGHGINSELEVNVMQNMVTMDKKQDGLAGMPPSDFKTVDQLREEAAQKTPEEVAARRS